MSKSNVKRFPIWPWVVLLFTGMALSVFFISDKYIWQLPGKIRAHAEFIEDIESGKAYRIEGENAAELTADEGLWTANGFSCGAIGSVDDLAYFKRDVTIYRIIESKSPESRTPGVVLYVMGSDNNFFLDPIRWIRSRFPHEQYIRVR